MPSCLAAGKSLLQILRRARNAWTASRRPSPAGPVEFLESRLLLSQTWFVAITGNDSAAGTLAQPFRTIQRAADVAGTGDTVLIRAGTYRETVHPAHSGVTFQNYNNENVVVSGADIVSNWSSYRGSIAQAAMSWDLGEGNNQVFVDGKMVNEARWPNTSTDLSHPTLAVAQNIADAHGHATLYDSHLSGGWAGATIHITTGDGWYAQTGTVTGSGPGWLSYTYTPDQSWTAPIAGDGYYLYGKFQGLDSPGEWFRDNNGQLYLWTPRSDDPNGHVVEAKDRQFAFDLSGRSNVTIEGIRIFAATIKTDAGSSNLVLDHVHATYLSQFTWQNTGWNQPWDSGIELNGANSTVENSVIQYSAGDGVYITASGAIVQNNVIRDVDYNAGDSAAIRTYGNNARISNNLVFNTGRSGIIIDSRGNHVVGNTIHDVLLLTSDGGAIYAIHQDGGGAEIGGNTIYSVHNRQTSPHQTWFAGVGIFLDDNSSNFYVHDNRVSDTDVAMKMNYTSRGNRVQNNILSGSLNSLSGNGQGDWAGTVVSGNVLYGSIYGEGRGASMSGNSFGTGTPSIPTIPDPPLDPSWFPPTGGNAGGSSGGSGGSSGGSSGGGSGRSTGGGKGTPGGTPTPAPGPTGDPGVATAPPPVTISAVSTIAAASCTAASGAQTSADGSAVVSAGSWLKFAQVNFGAGVRSLRAAVSAARRAGLRMEIRLDSPTGRILGAMAVPGGRRGRALHAQSASLRRVTGVHDLYLVFTGSRSGQVTLNTFIFMAPLRRRR